MKLIDDATRSTDPHATREWPFLGEAWVTGTLLPHGRFVPVDGTVLAACERTARDLAARAGHEQARAWGKVRSLRIDLVA